ncbi:MAG: addiction module protein [Hyphomicrobiaceae bacterium]
MSQHVKDLTEAARQLTREERLELVESILATLGGSDPEIERAWAKVANDRYEAYLRGETTARDAKDVLAEIRGRRASQ